MFKLSRYSKFYILALLIIGLLMSGSYFIMYTAIAAKSYDARIINISGAQRMLSQRIALLTMKLMVPEKREDAKAQLRESLNQFYTSHLALVYGDENLDLPGITSERIRELYYKKHIDDGHGNAVSLNDIILHYVKDVEKVLTLDDDQISIDNHYFLHAAYDYYNIVLPHLHNVVLQYERESLERTRILQALEFVVLMAGIVALFFVYFFLLRPMEAVIDQQTSKLKEANKKLEANQRREKLVALGQLAGGMAHEINNALQPILGLGEFIVDGLKKSNNERHLEYMQNIMNASIHMKGIIENVLRFTHQKNIEVENHSVYNLFKDAISFSVDIMSSTIVFKMNGLEEFKNSNYCIECNKTSFIQIFTNLFRNAADAMNEQGEITISLHKDFMPNDDESQAIRVEVADNGRGIEPEIINQIFDPFYTTKDISEGTGLGLSTVHGIVKNHSGHVSVKSVVGEGTTFVMYFPVKIDTKCECNDETQ